MTNDIVCHLFWQADHPDWWAAKANAKAHYHGYKVQPMHSVQVVAATSGLGLRVANNGQRTVALTANTM